LSISANRTTGYGCDRCSRLRNFSSPSRTSPAASYSRACRWKASVFISARRDPPAIFISARLTASGSWLVSSPARSADSSALRCHSCNPITIAPIARLPSGSHASRAPSEVRISSIVRYTACPDRMCPTSCPTTYRSSSSSSSSISPVLSTMNGLPLPIVIAFGVGSCTTYSSGTSSKSRM